MKTHQTPSGKTTQLPSHLFSWRRAAWHAYARYLASTKKPIFVGPWRGEIGFEVLYWIAFVEQFAHGYKIAPERLIPISRGGASSLYGMPSGVEIYAMRTPQEVRLENRLGVMKTGMFKQTSVTPFDLRLIRDAMDTMNVKDCHVLHPAWMYHTLAPFWTAKKGIDWMSPRVRYRILRAQPGILDAVTLPEQFIAVKFYSRMTFPGGHKVVQRFVLSAIEQMVSEAHIICLDHDHYLDDHSDITSSIRGDRVHHMSDFLPVTPENNLLIQVALLERSMGFVGTYGGFAQLALRMGKPSVSFYLDWNNATSIVHRMLADSLSLNMGVPAIVLRIAELPMLTHVLPEMRIAPSGPSPLALKTELAEARATLPTPDLQTA